VIQISLELIGGINDVFEERTEGGHTARKLHTRRRVADDPIIGVLVNKHGIEAWHIVYWNSTRYVIFLPKSTHEWARSRERGPPTTNRFLSGK
jgi:hypothetical protein